jgi:hypothetical protein
VRFREIHVRRVAPASPEAVYRLLIDGPSWPRWSPLESVELEREGDPPPEGVGAIRVNKMGRTTGRDQILELVPNRTFKYASLSGLPTRDYVGQVDLEPVAGGTAIHWHSSFRAKVPGMGWVLERGIARFLERCATGLAEHAALAQNA